MQSRNMSSNSSTTLITFLVRIPSHVRSVKLLGSWDNFSREYGMERDSRMGGGYWKGCHTFTNIICDGQVKNPARQGRDGALKMGGTYWYHYRIDDDVDFYNQDEPSTTSCPFLPGQPVNVLNVPISLPSASSYHRRDGSEASLTSINQTMNPQDKYLNPRPPPRPELPRLTTSPSPSTFFHRGPYSSSPITPPFHHGRSSSHPRETQPRRRFRPAHKSSPDLCASASSQTPRKSSNPFRTAFRNLASSPIFAGKNSEWGKVDRERAGGQSPNGYKSRKGGSSGHYHHGVDATVPQASELCSNCSSPLKSPMRAPSRENVRGRTEGNGGSIPRRDDSLPRNNRESQTLAEAKRTTIRPNDLNLDPIYSTAAGPGDDQGRNSDRDRYTITCKLDVGPNGTTTTTQPPDLNSKRLPTLPNSPSSVLEEETFSPTTKNGDYYPLNRACLQSRFSESTAPSTAYSSPDVTEFYPGGSHFSALTTADGESEAAMSPSSMTSATTFNNDSENEAQCHFKNVDHSKVSGIEQSLQETASKQQQEFNYHDIPQAYRDPGTEHNDSTVQSPLHYYDYDHDLKISGLYITKPGSKDSSHTTPRPHCQDHHLSLSRTDDAVPSHQKKDASGDSHGIMQEMFDEMSYLATAIQSNGDAVEEY